MQRCWRTKGEKRRWTSRQNRNTLVQEQTPKFRWIQQVFCVFTCGIKNTAASPEWFKVTAGWDAATVGQVWKMESSASGGARWRDGAGQIVTRSRSSPDFDAASGANILDWLIYQTGNTIPKTFGLVMFGSERWPSVRAEGKREKLNSTSGEMCCFLY